MSVEEKVKEAVRAERKAIASEFEGMAQEWAASHRVAVSEGRSEDAGEARFMAYVLSTVAMSVRERERNAENEGASER